MAKLTEKTKQPQQSVLIYGPPKVGKTQIVSELASDFNLVWFDLENGHATLFKLPHEQQEKIELIALPDSRSYPIAIETCLKVIKGTRGWIDEETGKWIASEAMLKSDRTYTEVHLNSLGLDTIVVFDSLTQLTNSGIAHITKNQPDDYKLQHDDWGNLGKLMDNFLSHVQQAKFHVVCISHETEIDLGNEKVKIVPTAGTRNFSRNTAKYFGHVIHAEVKNKKHTFSSSTTATMNIVTGSRTDVTTEKMDKPSLLPIFQGAVPAPPQTNGQKAAHQLASLIKR